MSEAEKIANALSAGPEMVVKDATVLDYPSDPTAGLVTLRKGTSEWTCLPDNAASPTNDPVCADAMWMKWFQAISTGTNPDISAPGIAYMLR